MIRDFYAYVFSKDRKKIEDKINEFSSSKSKRERWMADNLLPVVQNGFLSKSWYWLVKELTLLQKYYEALSDDRKEDIRTVYKKLVSLFTRDDSLDEISRFELTGLPYCLLQIRFEFKKPYISRDDDTFYIIDNPLSKERVFKAPYIRATTWKGALRFTALKIFLENIPKNKIEAFENRARIIKLFGNEKDKIERELDIKFNDIFSPDIPKKKISEEFFEYIVKRKYVNKEGNRRGRVIFYPTFLDRIELDVITPLDRVKRIPVRGPIFLEVAPGKTVNIQAREGAKGIFSLLYIPFDLVENLSSEKEAYKEIEEDLKFLQETILKTMCDYGFSAKKTSGYGVVENEIEFWINGEYNKGAFDDLKKETKLIIRQFGR